jgi:Uma2 family endonuclease
MAETYTHMMQMVDLIIALRYHFVQQGRRRVLVGGNQFIYYTAGQPRDNVSPDVYVLFDTDTVDPDIVQTWVEGKFPEVVFEITSPSTYREDREGKRALYARLGVQEYYIFDPEQRVRAWFTAYMRQGAGLEPVPLVANGGIVSPLLGVELRPVSMPATEYRTAHTWLRVIDLQTGEMIAWTEEEHHRLQEAMQARLAAESRAQSEEQARLAAEERAQREEQARLAAEERAARAEAMLRDLLARQERSDGGGEGRE